VGLDDSPVTVKPADVARAVWRSFFTTAPFVQLGGQRRWRRRAGARGKVHGEIVVGAVVSVTRVISTRRRRGAALERARRTVPMAPRRSY
jgi:hypothetical protein